MSPKDCRNDVTLENMVMSVDQDCGPELTAMLGAQLLHILIIPFDGPISTTQVAVVNGELYLIRQQHRKEVSDLALTVASTKEKVIMIEAGANEVPEAQMIDAIFAAHELNQKVIAFIETIVADVENQNMSIQAVQFRKNCLQPSKKLSLRQMEDSFYR